MDYEYPNYKTVTDSYAPNSTDSGTEKSAALRCLSLFFCCRIIQRLNKMGITPFAYHTTGIMRDKKRHEHYKASAVFGALAFWGVILTISEGFNQEQQWWGDLDNGYHQAGAAITLIAMDLVFSLAAAAIFYGIDFVRERCPIGERVKALQTGKFNEERISEKQSLIYRGVPVSSCHPAQACIPMTPTKIAAWAFGITGTLTTLVIAFLFVREPDLFKKLADSQFSHYSTLTTTLFTGTLATAGLFAAAHKASAVIHDHCCPGPKAYN